MLTLDRVSALSDAEREAARWLSQTVYPPQEWADWPGRHIEWDSPECCVRLRGEDGSLVSYVGVYVRDAEYDGQPVRIGGIGNVKTHPSARKQGFASLAIERAVTFLREQPLVFALLVCEQHLLGYYSRLGWKEFTGRLLIRQHGATTEFTLCRVMTLGLHSVAPETGTIDLCGPPW